MATIISCDFCSAEIPDEIPSKLVLVSIESMAEASRAPVHRLRKDACTDCAERIRRILNIVDGEQLKTLLDQVTMRP